MGAGFQHTVVLTKIAATGGEHWQGEGMVATCGVSSHGELGQGNTESHGSFYGLCHKEAAESIHGAPLPRAVAVAAGGFRTGMITVEGDLLLCGLLSEEGAEAYLPRPINIGNGCKVVKVALSARHAVTIVEGGRVFSWGRGRHGCLGHGDETSRCTPTLIADLSDAAYVAVGNHHSVVVDHRGEAYSWGAGHVGQLGHGKSHADAMLTRPRRVSSVSQVRLVACGAEHTFFLGFFGNVLACGKGSHGRLGSLHQEHFYKPTCPRSLRGVQLVSIAAGASHSVAVREDGVVLSTGLNDYGQLGCTEEALEQGYRIGFAPVSVPRRKVACSKGKRGTAACISSSSYHALEESEHSLRNDVCFLKGVAVCAGERHTLVVNEKGELVSFGDGSGGQGGHGDWDLRVDPKQVKHVKVSQNVPDRNSCKTVMIAGATMRFRLGP